MKFQYIKCIGLDCFCLQNKLALINLIMEILLSVRLWKLYLIGQQEI